jgi:PIN domain nuclease of toxin-antitoxin system
VRDSQYQLDASALLALIRDEPGSDVVSDRLDRCQIHAVNLAEVYRVMIRNGVAVSEATQSIAELQIPVDQQLSADQALAIAKLCHANPVLSLGDATCVAVAQSKSLIALTTEQSWRGIQGVELIR